MLLSLLAATTAFADDALTLPAPQPYALLQLWVTAYDMDQDPQADPASYGDPEDDIGVKVRRARLGFEGSADRLRYGLVFGTSSPYDAVAGTGVSGKGGGISVVDAYGGFRPADPVWVVAGVMRVPVSRENLMSAQDIAFQESAVATEWMTPGRDVGVMVDATMGPVRARLGGFNGNQSLLGDDGAGKLASARVEAAFGSGDVYQTYGAVDGLSLGVAVDGYLDQDLATRTVNAGGDVILRVAGLSVLAEGRYASLAPTHTDVADPDVLATTARLGLTGQLGYTVGSFEPAVRFSMYDDDTDASDSGDAAQAQIGVTWHGLEDHVRAGAGYVLRLETGGQPYSNDTARIWLQMAL